MATPAPDDDVKVEPVWWAPHLWGVYRWLPVEDWGVEQATFDDESDALEFAADLRERLADAQAKIVRADPPA